METIVYCIVQVKAKQANRHEIHTGTKNFGVKYISRLSNFYAKYISEMLVRIIKVRSKIARRKSNNLYMQMMRRGSSILDE